MTQINFTFWITWEEELDDNQLYTISNYIHQLNILYLLDNSGLKLNEHLQVREYIANFIQSLGVEVLPVVRRENE